MNYLMRVLLWTGLGIFVPIVAAQHFLGLANNSHADWVISGAIVVANIIGFAEGRLRKPF